MARLTIGLLMIILVSSCTRSLTPYEAANGDFNKVKCRSVR